MANGSAPPDGDAAAFCEAADATRAHLAIFHEALDAILIADDDRRYIDANASACELFGLPRDQLLTHRIDDFFGGGEAAEMDAMWRQFREVKRLGGEFPLRRVDGTTRVVEFRAIADFVPGRHLSIIRDITERVQEAERARSEAVGRAQAEAATRVKDQFIAMLGHELRNPLAPILTALQLMEMSGERHFERERRIIERNVRHLATLVDDLLDISRITHGQVVLRRETVELSAVVARALEVASPLLMERGHAIELDVAPGLAVDADPVRLAQVISNLLVNAAKYTDAGGHIAITAQRDGREVAIRVRDDGVGIARDLLPHVFEPFVQGQRTLDRARGGLGIGLALVRRLVELHGGTIAMTSEVGRGSELTLRLPAVEVAGASAAPAPAPVAPPPAPGAEPAAMPAQRRVLIVDDNVDAADLLALVLRRLGYAAHVAYDGEAALREARELSPQTVLLDIGLPGADGYEVARRLRGMPGQGGLQIIAISGYGMSSDLARSREAGIDLHLVKPVDVEQLRRALARSPGAGLTRHPARYRA